MKTFVFVVLVAFMAVLAHGYGTPAGATESFDNRVQPSERTQIEEALLRKINTKCAQHDGHSCMMLKIVTYMNRMLKKASIQIDEGIEIARYRDIPEDLPVEPELLARSHSSDETQLSVLVADKLWNFVRSRSLNWNIMSDTDLVVSSTDNGSLNIGLNIKNEGPATGRGKKGSNYGPLLAAAAMKIGLLKGLAFKGLALLVGKALLVSKMALLLAAIIGLKKLFSHEKHVTYEVVAHPHHSHHETVSHVGHGGHDSYSSGWGRAFPEHIVDSGLPQGDAQDQAYAAQKPAQ